MTPKAPSFQFYPKDWLEFKVLRMSDAAQGVYIRLLCHIWIGTPTQYSIPNDDKLLARVLNLSSKKWIKMKKEIQTSGDPCFIEKDGFLISKRLKEEREKQEIWREKSRLGGLKSARVRSTTLNPKDARVVQPPHQPKGNSSSSSSSSYKRYSHEERILRFWNGLSGRLKRRKLTGMRQTGSTHTSHKRAVSVASQRLKEYGYKLVRQAVYNYYRMWLYPKDERRWTYTLWGLTEFCGRGKDNVARFMDWDEVQTNFLVIKKKSWIDK